MSRFAVCYEYGRVCLFDTREDAGEFAKIVINDSREREDKLFEITPKPELLTPWRVRVHGGTVESCGLLSLRMISDNAMRPAKDHNGDWIVLVRAGNIHEAAEFGLSAVRAAEKETRGE